MKRSITSKGRVEHALLGVILRGLRTKAGLTQRELGVKLERDHSFVGKVERGKQPIDIPQLLDFIDAVGGDEVEVMRELREQRPRQKRRGK